MVGATGFEPATPCSQGKCATKLRYAPTARVIDEFAHEGKTGMPGEEEIKREML